MKSLFKILIVALLFLITLPGLSQNLESYSQDHKYGDTIYFSAYPQVGWRFVGWYRNDTLLSTQQFNFLYVAKGDAELIAQLEPIMYRIEVKVNPLGRGLISGSGEYIPGTVAMLQGESNVFLNFKGFIDENGQKIADNPFFVRVDRDRVLQASLAPQQWLIMLLVVGVCIAVIAVAKNLGDNDNKNVS